MQLFLWIITIAVWAARQETWNRPATIITKDENILWLILLKYLKMEKERSVHFIVICAFQNLFENFFVWRNRPQLMAILLTD